MNQSRFSSPMFLAAALWVVTTSCPTLAQTTPLTTVHPRFLVSAAACHLPTGGGDTSLTKVYQNMPSLEQKMVRAICSTDSLYSTSRSFDRLDTQVLARVAGTDFGLVTNIQEADLTGLSLRPAPSDVMTAEIGYKTVQCSSHIESMRKSLLSLGLISNANQVSCTRDSIVTSIVHG